MVKAPTIKMPDFVKCRPKDRTILARLLLEVEQGWATVQSFYDDRTMAAGVMEKIPADTLLQDAIKNNYLIIPSAKKYDVREMMLKFKSVL